MRTFANYRILGPIDEGVYTAIYRGVEHETGRPVIIKVLKNAQNLRESARLKHEYQIAKDLDIAGIVRPLSLEDDNNQLGLILEDSGGTPLSDLIAARSLNLVTTLRIAISLTDTLGALHRNNIIHKDVKPRNIIIDDTATGHARLIDFGIATRLSQESQRAGNPQQLEGTLAYMSPEQTGRMNRLVDYRTDFYTLGVTLYEMLTARLPFQTTDAMELVHSHIARRPTPPHDLQPALPQIVSDIIMKLLSKTAEDRYQHADGLKGDLQKCLEQLEADGRIESFPLGQHDVSDMFHIPQKLYGREAEIGALMAAFERVGQGASELMLVAGYSGVGKSALVNEMHKPVARERGYFIAGKFDQYKRNIPYASVIQAFQDLIRQILTESEDRIARWKEHLAEALGPNAQLIIDVIPEVELITGSQPPVQQLGPAESQNRFHMMLQNFIGVFARQEHPLALVLDDIQWADAASLKLIQLLTTDPYSHHLLLIGAYRDNEVNAAHPLMLTLDEIQKGDAIVQAISLRPLDAANVNQLIADTLRCDAEEARPLAELLLKKTDGNPFFLNQFLKSLYHDRLLSFDARLGRWQWSLARIQALPVTDNVVEFMAAKIRKLAPHTQRMVTLAACIGNEFDLKTLALIGERSPAGAAAELWGAIEEGLIVPIDADYKLLQGSDTQVADTLIAANITISYTFLHDRVQQAAYLLTPEAERQLIHLAIGRLMLAHIAPDRYEEHAFDIVNQLNFGAALIGEPVERAQLAQLNLIAGQKAKASTAYSSAVTYLAAGMELLAEDSWQSTYDLTIALYKGRSECEYLVGHLDIAEALFDIILAQARAKDEKADVYITRMVLYTNLGRYAEGVAVGLEGLTLFDIRFPTAAEELQAAVGAALMESFANRGDRQIGDLMDGPLLSNPEKQAAMKLLIGLTPLAYNTDPTLFARIILEMVNISLTYGNSDLSAYAYGVYGFILIMAMGDYEAAHASGRLALALNDRFNNSDLKGKIFVTFGAFTDPWREHIKSSIAFLKQAYLDCLESGDLIYAGFACWALMRHLLSRGDALDSVLDELNKYQTFAQYTKNDAVIAALTVIRQAILNLQGHTNGKASLSDGVFEETQFLAHMQQNNFFSVLNMYAIYKLQVSFLREQYHDALQAATEAESMIAVSVGQHIVTEMTFYQSLTLAALYPTVDHDEQQRYWEKLTSNREQLKKWADNCPANFQYAHLLVAAEMARCSGNGQEAVDLYDQAIEAAQTNGFIQHEAVGNELAAKFYQAVGKPKIARSYMADAHDCYVRWGATAKAQDLAETYPALLPRAIVALPQEALAGDLDVATSLTTTGHGRGEILDMMTVIKAAQAISGEIVLDTLLTRLMHIVLENAGAQKGLLILKRDAQLIIEAMITIDPDTVEVRPAIPVESSTDLAVEIVQYVSRTREAVVLQDAARQGRFMNDPYVIANQARSILCLPLIHQGQVTGILYLENNLATDVFTPTRIEILRLLSSQAAIALENALLYERVQQRTDELALAAAEAQAARSAAEQANELKSQFLANMSHELRTPLNSIINFTLILSTGRRGPLNEGQLDFLNRVLQSGEHLLGLINDILDLSKIEAGRMELYKETIDLAEVVPNVLETAAGLTKGRSIILREEIAPDLPPIEGDRTRIRQILLNLLSNAAKFTEQGSITVRVTQEDHELVVQVVDTGIGIAAEHLGEIFEEFRQVEGASNRRYEGTGLGLTIVRRLVELHNGRIWVESTPGVGSTFSFSLPIAVVLPTEPMLATRYTTAERNSVPILVIDDDSAAIEIVAEYLERDGYTVYGITDSRWALDEARRIQPAAIILDVLMPYKDGWQVLTELKADAALQSVPVALYTIVEEQKLGFYIGASAYLTKPISEPQLRTTVTQLVGNNASIMVIDDDPNALEIVSHHLEQAGAYRVTTANNGQAGLDQIALTRPDLIILDLMMPEVDGFAVLDHLERNPDTRTLPVIVLTAKDLTRDEHNFLQQRVRGLLAKGSTSPDQLLGKVSDLLVTITKQPLFKR
jgi:predicted ATPase/signal transduction histidine kinase/CheY-like chemotaxis protein/tRNA A-37 threonylcarbamoyl transferase component Bud32